MGLADLVTPVTATHGHHGQLSHDDGTADGGGHLLGALHTETKMAVEVTNAHERLEAGTLTGTGLLLNGHDLHHLILEGRAEEELDNLVLLHGERVKVDLLDRLNLALLDQATELGAGHPLLVIIALGSTTAPTATAAIATASTTTAAIAKSAAEATALTTCTISHDGLVVLFK